MQYMRPISTYFPEMVWDVDDDILLRVLLDKLGGEVEISTKDFEKVRGSIIEKTTKNSNLKLTLFTLKR